VRLPRFVWLKAEGKPGRDDLGLSHLILIVSERALGLLKRVGGRHLARRNQTVRRSRLIGVH
jgi:hypothetical protein